MKVTRRKLAGMLLAPAAGSALAQAQTAAVRSPEEELKTARDRLRAIGETLAKQDVPVSTEPAFRFIA
jgi:hypothetical protein